MSCEKDIQAKEVTISVNEYNNLLKCKSKFKYLKNILKKIENIINNEECDDELDKFIKEETNKLLTIYEFNKQANEIYNKLVKMDRCPHRLYLENVPYFYCKVINACVMCPNDYNICPNYINCNTSKDEIKEKEDKNNIKYHEINYNKIDYKVKKENESNK